MKQIEIIVTMIQEEKNSDASCFGIPVSKHFINQTQPAVWHQGTYRASHTHTGDRLFFKVPARRAKLLCAAFNPVK